jgi:hypothetical protein
MQGLSSIGPAVGGSETKGDAKAAAADTKSAAAAAWAAESAPLRDGLIVTEYSGSADVLKQV